MSPIVRKRRLGAELRRLRIDSGLTGGQVAQRLLISQPKISRLENGHCAISPRDVRDLCSLYGVTNQQVLSSLMRMAEESGQQGWWNAYGDIPCSVYIGLETDARSIRCFAPMVIPDLLQTPAYAQAVIEETIPPVTAEQTSNRLKVRLRRQHRIYDPADPLRLSVILDESTLRRVVGGPGLMREQLEHLNALSAEPHITVQVLPCAAGALPGVAGSFSILSFADNLEAEVVHVEGSTSDLYLEKRSELEHYDLIHAHLQARALSPGDTRHFVSTIRGTYDRATP
ncbi:helix-turn-helix transcriptional regulator [Streptomyces sp. NPDC049970]|uniref:helix-turn-helix domain-containing protein n=1 Tax=Streptomyces sp. NPDC049970 TaxID=3155033 RepID=UPI0034321902